MVCATKARRHRQRMGQLPFSSHSAMVMILTHVVSFFVLIFFHKVQVQWETHNNFVMIFKDASLQFECFFKDLFLFIF